MLTSYEHIYSATFAAFGYRFCQYAQNKYYKITSFLWIFQLVSSQKKFLLFQSLAKSDYLRRCTRVKNCGTWYGERTNELLSPNSKKKKRLISKNENLFQHEEIEISGILRLRTNARMIDRKFFIKYIY